MTILTTRARGRAAVAAGLLALSSVLAAPAVAGAQQTPPPPRAARPQVPPGEPARFLQRFIGLTPQQIEQAARGAVVTKVLDVADQEEIALFGIVAVDAPREQVVQRVRDLPTFLRTPGRTAFGLFGTPAKPEDARAYVVDPSDLQALRACRRGDCDVKMPMPRFAEFGAIDWSAPGSAERVSALVRQRMADFVEIYRRSGTAAMPEYGDQKTPRRAGEVFASLLAQSPYLYEYVPSFQKYLERYPAAASLPGVTDAIYWSTDKLPSLRPISGITHVTIFAPPDAPLTLVSAKQLYASHYFLGAFTLTTLLDGPEAPPGGRGTYYIVVQRMRFDHLPSGGLLNIRGRVLGKMHEALRAELVQRKGELERGTD